MNNETKWRLVVFGCLMMLLLAVATYDVVVNGPRNGEVVTWVEDGDAEISEDSGQIAREINAVRAASTEACRQLVDGEKDPRERREMAGLFDAAWRQLNPDLPETMHQAAHEGCQEGVR